MIEVYWHFFTFTANYNSPHIELILNDVCLTIAAWRTSLHWMQEWTRFVTAREPNKDHRLQEFHYHSSWMFCLGNLLIGNGVPTVDCDTTRMCLPKRCLAMDARWLHFFGFQPSCRNHHKMCYTMRIEGFLKVPSLLLYSFTYNSTVAHQIFKNDAS
jgi:hypothetical protein